MTSSVLAAFEEATAEAEAFANHPIAKSGLEEQILYLQGLALVMNVDDDIDQREQEYLSILLNSFGLDAGMLEGLSEFARNPDKGTIQGFVTCFRRRPIAQLFLFDALIMSHRDSQLHEHETTLINSMVDKLEIKHDTQKSVRALFANIQNKEWDQCVLDLKSPSIDAQYFEYYLQYQGVDIGQQKFTQINSNNSQSYLSSVLRNRLSKISSGTFDSGVISSVENGQESFRIYPIYTVSASPILDGCSIDNIHINPNTWMGIKSNLFTFNDHENIIKSESVRLLGRTKIIDVYATANDVIRAGDNIATLCFSDIYGLTNCQKNRHLEFVETRKFHVAGSIEDFNDVRELLSPIIMRSFLQNLINQKEAVVDIPGHSVKTTAGIKLCELSKLGLSYNQKKHVIWNNPELILSYSNTDIPVELLHELFDRVQ